MKLLLLLIIAVALGQEGIESALKAAAKATREGDGAKARKHAVVGLKQIRDRALQLRDDSKDCPKEGEGRKSCRDTVAREIKMLRKLRVHFRDLEACFNGKKATRAECADKVEATVMYRSEGTAAKKPKKPLKKGAEVPAVKKAIKSADKGNADDAGDDAVRVMRQRLETINQELRACTTESCRKQKTGDKGNLRAEAMQLAEMEKCVARFQDKSLRKQCMAAPRAKLLSLIEKAKKGKKAPKKPVKATKKTKTEKKLEKKDKKTKKLVVKKVENAIKAVSDATKGSPKAVKEAMKALSTRVQNFEGMKRECAYRKDPVVRETCEANVAKGEARNKKERKLVDQLTVCARRFKKNKVDRINCVAAIARKLMPMVQPLSAKEAPASLPRLEKAEEQKRKKLKRRIKTLRADLEACDNTECRDRVRNAILVSRTELDTIDDRYRPRRECLMKRRRMRTTEFRTRAVEHLRLYRLHKKASDCSSRKCSARYEEKQHKLERQITKHRASRAAAWNKFRCPVVLPKTSKASTTLTSASTTRATAAPSAVPVPLTPQFNTKKEKKASKKAAKLIKAKKGAAIVEEEEVEEDEQAPRQLPAQKVVVVTRHKRGTEANRLRATLHLRLNKLYTQLDDCDDVDCKVSVRSLINGLKERLRRLSRTRVADVKRDHERHERRAKLHKRMEYLYSRAADCPDRKCRKDTRNLLKKYQKDLAKLKRSALGSKEMDPLAAHHINKNRYINELRGALAVCAAGPKGRPCRVKVFDAFRSTSELRDRAVVHHLEALVKRRVKREVKKCAAGSPKKLDACVEAVRKWEAKRLNQLQKRLVKIEKRQAERMCEETADAKACVISVRKEFKKDRKRVKVATLVEASKDVKKAAKKVAPAAKVRSAPTPRP